MKLGSPEGHPRLVQAAGGREAATAVVLVVVVVAVAVVTLARWKVQPGHSPHPIPCKAQKTDLRAKSNFV